MNASWRTLEALLKRHQAMVFSVALRITGNREAAEEVAQDVFLELHRCMNSVQSEEHALFWLRKVAAHRAIDAARRCARIPETAADVSDLPGESKPSESALGATFAALGCSLAREHPGRDCAALSGGPDA